MTVEESSDEKMPPNEAETAATNAASKMDPETEPLNAGAAGDVKVKFIGGAEAVDVEKGGAEAGAGGDVQAALTKSELMKYAKDPFWVTLRWALFILFWVGWLAMLVASVIIIIYAPKCPSPAPKKWWQRDAVYEVYVKSFKDSDGDGNGDLKGVSSKLDYLENLGVKSVWLSPIYKSPMNDHGYDVSDYKDVDPSFGSLDDFKALVADMHGRDMKVIMDFIPNHSSKEHPWFAKSVNKESPFTDYYVWADGKANGPPNNWRSVFGGSAWTLDPVRGQYYLHQFYASQPDLNLRNDAVVKELTDILQFWVDLGVDGFRVDSVGHFFEDENLADEADNGSESGYKGLTHDKTFDLPEVLDLLKKFRKVLDDATAQDEENPRIMMTEAYMASTQLARYYGNIADEIGDISHLPLNFNLLSNFDSQDQFSAETLKKSINDYMAGLPNGSWPNFALGNHDHSRVATRLGADKVDAMNMILMMLRGTPFTYYGEELGMVDGSSGAGNRDAYRTPMQWDDSANAGFTSSEPWLPVNSDYANVNVEAFETVENSHTKIFREMAELRNSETILFGSSEMKVEGDVFVLARIKKGNPGYVLIANFGDAAAKISVAELKNMGERGILTLAVPKGPEAVGATVDVAEVSVESKQSILVTFVPKY